ncbi:MAG TPA: MATE family efflux transporter, partial [Kiloniellales bacterium]|nr:MATE family efflux transporter [Kiloniellales bacterium]
MAGKTTPSAARTRADRERPWRDELAASLSLAWPFALMQLAQISINATLLVMCGRLGATELAGSALGLQVFLSVFLFALGLAIAVAPMVAQARGAHDMRQVRGAFCQGLWATGLIAVPGAVLLWFSGGILRAAGQDPAVATAAAEFTRPMALGLPGWLWFFVVRNYMGAMDRPRPALYVMIVAIALNFALGYALIFGKLGLPYWGVFGAGFTAALVGWVLLLGLLGFALADKRLRRLNVPGELFRLNWPQFREVFRIGVPMGLAMLFETTLFLAVLYVQGLISTDVQAAHAVVMQLAAMAFMVPLGVSQAATVRVGLAVGRNDPPQARRAALVALSVTLGCALVAGFIFLLLPTLLVRQFLDLSLAESAAVLAMAGTFLAITAAFQMFDGLQVASLGVLRGLKDTRVPTYITCFGYWIVGFPLA